MHARRRALSSTFRFLKNGSGLTSGAFYSFSSCLSYSSGRGRRCHRACARRPCRSRWCSRYRTTLRPFLLSWPRPLKRRLPYRHCRSRYRVHARPSKSRRSWTPTSSGRTGFWCSHGRWKCRRVAGPTVPSCKRRRSSYRCGRRARWTARLSYRSRIDIRAGSGVPGSTSYNGHRWQRCTSPTSPSHRSSSLCWTSLPATRCLPYPLRRRANLR